MFILLGKGGTFVRVVERVSYVLLAVVGAQLFALAFGAIVAFDFLYFSGFYCRERRTTSFRRRAVRTAHRFLGKHEFTAPPLMHAQLVIRRVGAVGTVVITVQHLCKAAVVVTRCAALLRPSAPFTVCGVLADFVTRRTTVWGFYTPRPSEICIQSTSSGYIRVTIRTGTTIFTGARGIFLGHFFFRDAALPDIYFVYA